MVESPHDKIYLSVDAADLVSDAKKGDEKSAEIEPEMLLVKRPLVTATLRSARRFLIAQGGLRAAFRGFSLYVAYTVAGGLLSSLWSSMLGPFVSAFASSLIMCRLMLTWTHVVVAQPSSKSWWKRIPAPKTFLEIAPATALWAAAEQLTVLLPSAFFRGLGLDRPVDLTGDDEANKALIGAFVVKNLVVGVVALATFFLILIPARVTLTRVQTSMLPEDEDTIVPVDRTFDGKVADGGKLGLLDAWRTFDWAARGRLLKLYVKVAFVEMFLTVMFLFVIVTQVQVITGTTVQDWVVTFNAKVAEERGLRN